MLRAAQRHAAFDRETALELGAKAAASRLNPACAESTLASRKINDLGKKSALHFGAAVAPAAARRSGDFDGRQVEL